MAAAGQQAGVVTSQLGTGDVFELDVLRFVVAVTAALLPVGVAERHRRSRPRG